MKTLSQYCANNILVIPQALFGMPDVTTLMQDGDSAILYKCLQQDLTDVEFYTNVPCLVYIESGTETITSADNEIHQLKSGSAILLPRGANLHSDFVQSTEQLRAYLLFFDNQLISEFLSNFKAVAKPGNQSVGLFKLHCKNSLELYFNSLQQLHQQKVCSPALLKLKLLELLHLIYLQAPSLVDALAQKAHGKKNKRNLQRLLDNNQVLNLSISDMANLSGWSLSSFSRDFKALYKMPPKQWLQQRRMSQAHQLLLDTDQSVTDVALTLGFENISHFIKLFKQQYQVTPKQIKLRS
ncbi:MAG: AraC family transcriptional regulator [Pseudomonadales bacterium]|nr:AraC family transcriptional regulator [Pseudomonadales bacterium]